MFSRRVLGLIAGVATFASVSVAQIIEVTISGNINTIFQTSVFWDASIAPNIPFTTKYRFGPALLDTNADVNIGEYTSTGFGGVETTVGNYVFSAPTSYVLVSDNAPFFRDTYVYQALGSFVSSGISFSGFGLRTNLASGGSTAFSSDAFPTTAVSLSSLTFSHDFVIYGTFAGGTGTAQLGGPVTGYSISILPAPAVPEPATYALFGVGCLGLIVLLRNRRKVTG